MARLPYSRVVRVTVTRRDAFPSRRGFGVPLFLTSTTKAGILDASNLTRLYSSMDEVTDEWDTSDDFYKAATAAFAQNPRPIQIKAGWYDATGADADSIVAALNAIEEADPNWYWLCVETALRDTALIANIPDWVQARTKQAIIDSNDADMETATDTANFAAVHKGTVDRTSVFYHTSATEHCAFALAAKLGTFNFDDADSHYTAKFKSLAGVAPINKGSAAVTAITGFQEELGQSETAGHMANTYIDIGGRDFVVEGSTLTANVFIDEVHASDWIILRTEEEALGILLNNSSVPFTDNGMEMLASAARTVMRQAFRAGIVAEDLDPLTGEYEAAYSINVPSVFDVPESQRKARIAPAVDVVFRYAGAVHYAKISFSMTF